jgi:hypothetical protein
MKCIERLYKDPVKGIVAARLGKGPEFKVSLKCQSVYYSLFVYLRIVLFSLDLN